MKSAVLTPANAFTFAIGAVLAAAFIEGLNYSLRASILILVVCATGIMLIAFELVLSIRRNLREQEASQADAMSDSDKKMIYDTPMMADDGTSTDRRRGMTDIWVWYLGLMLAVWVFGFHIAIPAFAVLYGRTHGGTWTASIIMAAILLSVIVFVFTLMMGTPWPTPIALELLGVERLF